MEHAYKREDEVGSSSGTEESAFIMWAKITRHCIRGLIVVPLTMVFAVVMLERPMSMKDLLFTTLVPGALLCWVGFWHSRAANFTSDPAKCQAHVLFYRHCVLAIALLALNGVVGLATMLQNLPALVCAR